MFLKAIIGYIVMLLSVNLTFTTGEVGWLLVTAIAWYVVKDIGFVIVKSNNDSNKLF